MCYVDKGKGFAVGPCNYEVVLCFIRVFNPVEKDMWLQVNSSCSSFKINHCLENFFNNLKNLLPMKYYQFTLQIPEPYLHLHSPLEFCISDQHSGIADVFAVLPHRQPGEDFRVTILEFVEEADVSVRVASFLHVHQICPTRLRGISFDDLVKTASYICQRETKKFINKKWGNK